MNRIEDLEAQYPDQVSALRIVTADWPADSPRWDALLAATEFHKREVLSAAAEKIRSRMSLATLSGVAWGLDIAANLIDPEVSQ